MLFESFGIIHFAVLPSNIVKKIGGGGVESGKKGIVAWVANRGGRQTRTEVGVEGGVDFQVWFGNGVPVIFVFVMGG